MTLLITQILTTLLTAIVSIIALNKDLRAKTEKLKSEAKLIKRIIFFITVVSIGNSVLSYVKSQADNDDLRKDKRELTQNLTSLREQNDNLSRKLTGKYLEQSDKIIKIQQASTKDLIHASQNLHDLINGSDSIPLFSFYVLSDTTLACALANTSDKPLYNLNVRIVNYDKLLKCKTNTVEGKFYIDYDCFYSSGTELSIVNVINGHASLQLPIPYFVPFKQSLTGRYALMIAFKGYIYTEQLIYSIEAHNFKQAIRIQVSKDSTVIKKWTVKNKVYTLIVKDWDKKFPLPNSMPLQKL